ncbi:MAG: hypothetical protein JWO42_1674, partial [Chloroflexi bacterium]|nr:hypothetical protein [Chloroflexota bacterium]
HVGTGLGLYICRQLVERMGGRIWYEPNRQDAANAGSTFRVQLPLDAGTEPLVETIAPDLIDARD